MQRLAERVYDQPLINNVERGAYVECLVELAMKSLDPRWCLTATWDAWDLEHSDTLARIEIKQSSALQRWKSSASPVKSTSSSFDIAPRQGYWWTYSDGETCWVPTDLCRQADVYVLAWHGEDNPSFTDHRQARQWRFFVLPESQLPPGQKSISLNPLHNLVEPCDYHTLAEAVTKAVPDPPLLKASIIPPPKQWPESATSQESAEAIHRRPVDQR